MPFLLLQLCYSAPRWGLGLGHRRAKKGGILAVVSYEQLRALDVLDSNDVVVGVLSDLVVDTEENDVLYVLMTPAGVLEGRGLGNARFPVPLRALEFLGDRLRLAQTADVIRKAPPIAPDQPLNASAEYRAKIFGFWGVVR